MGGGQGVSAGGNSGEENGNMTVGRQGGGEALGCVGRSNVANTTGLDYK